MCGLFGWVKKADARPSRHKQRCLGGLLALLNDQRGGDSWGVSVEGDEPCKGLGHAGRMSDHILSLMSGGSRVLGHTRKATTGAVIRENSHPFVVGEVIGAHNGMVANHHDLNLLYDRECEVDSQHIFHHINDGLGSFSDVEAYGAITFELYDIPGEVYLGRFNDGELAVCEVDGFGIVWSSALGHLKQALRLSGLSGRVLKLEEGQCYVAGPEGLFRAPGVKLDFQDPWSGWLNRATAFKATGMSSINDDDTDELYGRAF